MSGRISSSVFVGREQERARLLEVAAAVHSGDPRIVLLCGDAGIGKTRLLTEFTDELSDTTVLVGGCLQLGDAAAPLAPMAEILRTLQRQHHGDPGELDHLLSGRREPLRALLGSVALEPASPRLRVGAERIHEAALSLLEELATTRPLVAVFEDMHWATSSTLELTTFLAHNPPQGPALLVLTYRGDELHRRHPLRGVLATLGRLATVERIDLPPLTPAEQRRQVASIRGDVDERHMAAVLARAEGNAFYAEELLASSTAGLRGLPGPLQDILADRLFVLPEDATEIVRITAAAGRSIDHRLLAQVADLDDAALDRGLRTAVEHGILLADSTGYRFRHALMQEAAYDALLPGERLRLHGAIADALSREPDLAVNSSPDAEIAHHAAEARLFDRAYTSAVAAAARFTETYAFDAALEHYEMALALRGSCSPTTLADGPSRLDLLCRTGVAADAAGETHRAIAHLHAALREEAEGATDAEVADVLNILAITHAHTSDVEAGSIAAERAIALAPPHSRQLATALATQALHLAIPSGRPDEAIGSATKAVDLSRSLGDGEGEAVALTALGTAHGKLGDLDTAEAILRDSIAVALANGMVLWATRSHINLGSILGNAGFVDRAREVEEAWLERCAELDYVVDEIDFLRCNHVEGLLNAGRIREAATEFAAVRRRTSTFLVNHRLITALMLHVVQARFDDAEALVRESAEHILRIQEPQYLHPLAHERAMVALSRGRLDEAWALLDEVRGVVPERGSPELLRPAGARVEADRIADLPDGHEDRLRALERIDELHRDLTAMLDDTEPGTVWSRHLDAALAQVAAERSRATDEPDPEAWAEAERAVAAQGRQPEVAYLRIRRAEALVGVGDRDAATALLGEVHADCVERGMVWVAQQAESLAKRARLKLPGMAGPGADPFGLTERERDVLALVAHGLTNPQIGQRLFISTKTASVHVSNILAKVGATNRNRAGAIAREHGLAGIPEPSPDARGPRAH